MSHWFGVALASAAAAACVPSTHQVTYKVGGDPDWPKTDGRGSSAHIVIQNDNGGTEQHDVFTPYSQTLTVPTGSFVYVSAQAKEGLEISCEIDEDGQLLKQSRSDGEYSIATCSASA